MPVIEIKIPGLGESVSEATISKINKPDGSPVATDEVIMELETDKAMVEVRAEKAGGLKLLVKKGDTVKVGDTVAKIDTAVKAAAAPAVVAAATAPTKAEAPSAPAQKVVDLKAVGLDDLSPAVRALVIENKLQTAQIPASGPGGRLTKEDVLAFIIEQGEGGETDSSASAQSHKTQGPDGMLSTLGTTNVPARTRTVSRFWGQSQA